MFEPTTILVARPQSIGAFTLQQCDSEYVDGDSDTYTSAEGDCDEDVEWKALIAYRTQNSVPPDTLPTLREATRMVAQIGGFLARNCDGEPGTETICRGLTALDYITFMGSVMARQKTPLYQLRC